ncbi:fibromodulin [Ambystoma mexicanum]|uniref:fibromodulin n=1 Tax=Ambystoma mexicanum TaxID=8296 RepID=UPI0037E953AF
MRHLLLVGMLAALCPISLAQYDDDTLWWISYLRSRYYGYGPSYNNGPSYSYGQSYDDYSAPLSTDCPGDCDCPPNFPTAMYCDSRNMKHLPYVPSRMKYIYFQNNQITGIQDGAFENATSLVWIALQNNQLLNENIGRRVFSKLRSLERLYLDHNNLTRVPAGLPRSLRELHLSYNQLPRIQNNALEGLENLTSAHFHRNQIQDVGSAFKGLKSLVFLDLSNNNLRKVPDSLPDTVEQLYLEFNNINIIPAEYFKSFRNLQYLRISHNHLTNDGIPSNTFNSSSLLELDLSHNRLQRIPPVNTNLEHLYLQGNQIQEFSVSSFCSFVDITNFSKLQVLRLEGNEIKANAIPGDSSLCLRRANYIDI